MSNADSGSTSEESVARRRTVKQIFLYLVNGGAAFAIDFLLLILFKSVIGVPAWLAAGLAFGLSTVFAFFAQKHLTFKSDAPTGRALFRYLILLAVNTVFTALVVQFFDSHLDMYLIGKIVSTGITTLWNFPIMGHWVYSQRGSDSDDGADL